MTLDRAVKELYRLPPVKTKPAQIGDIIEDSTGSWMVISVDRILRPFVKNGQDTYTVGYTYGLKGV